MAVSHCRNCKISWVTEPRASPGRRSGTFLPLTACGDKNVRKCGVINAQLVKRIWDYVKANDRQDPSNKQRFILDEKMSTIFTAPVNMFSMNKQVWTLGAAGSTSRSVDAIAGIRLFMPVTWRLDHIAYQFTLRINCRLPARMPVALAHTDEPMCLLAAQQALLDPGM